MSRCTADAEPLVTLSPGVRVLPLTSAPLLDRGRVALNNTLLFDRGHTPLVRSLFPLLLSLLLMLPLRAEAQGGTFSMVRGQEVLIELLVGEPRPAWLAAGMLSEDIERVLGAKAMVMTRGLRDADTLPARIAIVVSPRSFAPDSHETYRLSVDGEGRLLVEGSDALGAAFGAMEISRRMGVSPWQWWAEAETRELDEFTLTLPEPVEESPYVEHRGIFINDEDWGLAPWGTRQWEEDVASPWAPSSPLASKTWAASVTAAADSLHNRWRYTIGPGVTERICQLLLRLKADTYCPAMHDDTRPFFLTPGNRETVAAYGLYLATSHCEPMVSNTNGEWDVRGEGDYNFATNAPSVLRFWRERLEQVSRQPVIYTLGMRGKHDSPMLGAETVEERRLLLGRVLDEQQRMLREVLGEEGAKEAPKVFIPYKEVLDVVDAGLAIPEDVAVIQCDDNYGYIRWPNDSMLTRPAGTGLYYHVSYWGRPHDYLWLSTTHPRIMQEELTRFALAGGRQRMWVLNVGDLKPAEYQTQLFMDIAWNPHAFASPEAWRKHLSGFLSQSLPLSLGVGEMGVGDGAAMGISERADSLALALGSFYDLMLYCRPEFLAGTRTEESDPRWGIPTDLPWSESRLRLYRDSLLRLSTLVDRREPTTAWMHLVQYPVQGAAQMAVKHVTATLASHGLEEWEACDLAYDSIQALTSRYNSGLWQGFMDASPRRLPVFQRVKPRQAVTPLPSDEGALLSVEYTDSLCCLPEGGCMELPQFSTGGNGGESVIGVEVSVLPTHPRHGERLVLAVSVDGGEEQTLDFTTEGRSEEWKRGVLANKLTRETTFEVRGVEHNLTLTQVSGGEVYPLGVRITQR